MTKGRRRRISLVLLGLCLVLIGVIGWQMWMGIQNSRKPSASYLTGTVVQPVTSALCPGEVLVYEQSINIDKLTMLDISREWCNRDGTCIMALHQAFENVVTIPIDFRGRVSHVVPQSSSWKPGGLYEFRSGIRNGDLSVQIVPFSIRTDCPAP